MKKLNSILLIDDDPISQYLNQKLLKKLNICDHIQLAVNGAEAIYYLQSGYKSYKRELPDLIFLDLNMPVMDGFEFLRHYEQLTLDTKRVKIIILTTSSDSNDIRMAKGHAFICDYFIKPLTEEKLLTILKSHYQ